MDFIKIDKEKWQRKKVFELYSKDILCTYSMTINLDITGLKNKIEIKQLKFFPVILYGLSKFVNKYKEFRMDLNEDGELGYYDKINLIIPKRALSKYRTYNNKDVMLAKYIQVLKYMGYSLDRIRDILTLYDQQVGDECAKKLELFFDTEAQKIMGKIREMEQVLEIFNEGRKHVGELEGTDNLVLNIFEIIKPGEKEFIENSNLLFNINLK
mgnify:CR=1 FL=1